MSPHDIKNISLSRPFYRYLTAELNGIYERNVVMKKLLTAVAIVGSFATVSLATTAPAVAREAFSFSFDTGNVHMGYRNGYYDNRGRWHNWRSAREAREFRSRYNNRYSNRWYDSDRDGVPNRYDRDRDGDGTPNRFDDRPNNPYRD